MTTFEVTLNEEHVVQCSLRIRQFNAVDKTGLRRWLAIHMPIEFKWGPATETGDPQAPRRQPAVRTPYVIAMMLLVAMPVLLIDPAGALRMAGKILLVLTLGLVGNIFLLMLLSRYLFWRLRKGIRKSPYYNSRIEIELDQTGLESKGQADPERTAWSAFQAVCRFDDGLLFQKSGNEFIWLPFATITRGSQNEAEQLLRENFADYRTFGKSR